MSCTFSKSKTPMNRLWCMFSSQGRDYVERGICHTFLSHLPWIQLPERRIVLPQESLNHVSTLCCWYGGGGVVKSWLWASVEMVLYLTLRPSYRQFPGKRIGFGVCEQRDVGCYRAGEEEHQQQSKRTARREIEDWLYQLNVSHQLCQDNRHAPS